MNALQCNEFGQGAAVATEVFAHTAGAWLPACFSVPPAVGQCIFVAPWVDIAAHVAGVPGVDTFVGSAATEACDFTTEVWSDVADDWNSAVSDWKAEWNGLASCLDGTSPETMGGCLSVFGL